MMFDLSPGLTAGGGLKHAAEFINDLARSFPRPHRRGQIETGHRVKLPPEFTFPPASPPGAD